MRADRLLAALLVLQARERVTAADLAGELEVSVATARRDLEALSAAGVPVYPRPGRGGGWSLVGGARTDLSGLSATEARALFLLVGPAAATSAEARAALRKLVRALPSTFRADAEAAAAATVVDPAGWGARDRPRPGFVDLLQEAVVRRRKVRLTYVSAAGARSERLVDPWGLVDKDEAWYLVAGTERGRRTFRLDRVVAAEATGEEADRPEGFALADAWEQVVGEVEERRSRTWATVLVEARFVPVLQDQFGRHCHVADADADAAPGRPGGVDGRAAGAGTRDEAAGAGRAGDTDARRVGGPPPRRARVRVGAPTPRDIAQTLAGWGSLVEVQGPPAVRAELGRIGAELVGHYATGG